ncbi:hypothetical protein [Arthrobacter sp. 92]|uniref:hypothetical protein n=1 Tax=Arthrobacter sp. 92 TaxID=3418175 RepID=UPI003CFC4D68
MSVTHSPAYQSRRAPEIAEIIATPMMRPSTRDGMTVLSLSLTRIEVATAATAATRRPPPMAAPAQRGIPSARTWAGRSSSRK